MRDHLDTRPPVVVAGGGWAGLSAAVNLCRRKVPVLLLESARQLGGRARSLRIDETVYDNGQHLMVGAYEAMLRTMQLVGVDVDAAFERLPLTLQLYKGKKSSLKMRAAGLPAPAHLLVALIGARGLSPRERLRALRFSRRVLGMQIAPDEDISVRALMHSQAQTPALMRKLWEPLCIAILNTPAQIASARLFVGVLRILVAGIRRHTDLLIPRRELGALFPRPAGEYLELHGARVELGQRVTGMKIDERGVRAVQVGSRRIPCSQLILATPHVISRRLLAHHPALQALGQRLTALTHEPVTTVYLQYPPETQLPIPMIGLEDALAQWVFDRRVCKQPGLMAVVISTRGEHMRLTAEELTARVAAELARSFPRWPAYRHARVLREKRATFSARAGIDAVRPGNRTVVPGLWLAGDYTATGLPATLEGAVRSGEACAQEVFDVLQD